MSSAPERLWAWHWYAEWDENPPLSGPHAIAQFGYCRPTNRRPLDNRERKSGADYIRTDLYDAAISRAEMAEARIIELEGKQ